MGKVGRLGWLGPGSDFGSKKLSLICVLSVKVDFTTVSLQSGEGKFQNYCVLSVKIDLGGSNDGRTN